MRVCENPLCPEGLHRLEVTELMFNSRVVRYTKPEKSYETPWNKNPCFQILRIYYTELNAYKFPQSYSSFPDFYLCDTCHKDGFYLQALNSSWVYPNHPYRSYLRNQCFMWDGEKWTVYPYWGA